MKCYVKYISVFLITSNIVKADFISFNIKHVGCKLIWFNTNLLINLRTLDDSEFIN